ncbi:hypothetical protein BDW67DRAFT_179947 [Aspergillus spinulosporus]
MAMGSENSPSPSQIALALAIVKLKPVGLETKGITIVLLPLGRVVKQGAEFILQCREAIKASQTADIFHSPQKFFDSVSFWKQAYEKSEAEKSTLLDRIFELEQRNEELVEKLRTREDVLDEITPSVSASARETLKRAVTSNQAPRKRLKTLPYLKEHSSDVDAHASHVNILGQPERVRDSTTPFVRQSYVLHKSLQRNRDSTSIVRAAVVLCKTCENELVTAVPQDTAGSRSKNGVLKEPQLSHLSLVLCGVESSAHLLFKAVRKLHGTRGSEKETGLLTYHIVCLYAAIMNCLERYCNARAVPVRIEYQEHSKHSIQTRSMTRVQTKSSNEPDSHSHIGDDGATQLASLLNRMVTSLDKKCPEHRRLLEGFLHILLNRAGKVLTLFVFQDLQLRPNLRMDPDKLPLPAGLIGAEVDGKSLGVAQTEAKYLVFLVRGALAVLDKHPTSLSASLENPPEVQFLSSIKARLQNTLVEAIFGADLGFEQTLERPAAPQSFNIRRLLEDHQPPEISVSEWYIQELWQLLGWEMLTKSIFRT